jgi:hypothetical protein
MKKRVLLYITITVFTIKVYSQKGKDASVNEKQKKYIEIDVIKTYERVAGKGYKSVDMFKKIANSYYSNFELEKAVSWYCELFAMTSNLEFEYYYRYSESLKSIGQNKEAYEILKKFNQKEIAIKEEIFKKQL